MPIIVLSMRMFNMRQFSHKIITGRADMSYISDLFVYPSDITATPEELFRQFKKEADPSVLEEVSIPDGTIISAKTHQKTFLAFSKWLEGKGFRSFSDLEKKFPFFEIPAQVTITRIRHVRGVSTI